MFAGITKFKDEFWQEIVRQSAEKKQTPVTTLVNGLTGIVTITSVIGIGCFWSVDPVRNIFIGTLVSNIGFMAAFTVWGMSRSASSPETTTAKNREIEQAWQDNKIGGVIGPLVFVFACLAAAIGAALYFNRWYVWIPTLLALSALVWSLLCGLIEGIQLVRAENKHRA